MDGIAWAASAMEAARSRLDIATQNLANVSTDGFARRVARGALTALGARVAVVVSPQRGSLRRTGRPYDLAILGTGAFRVRDERGAIVATRAGSFAVDRDGHLRDAADRTLLDRKDRPVVVGASQRPDERSLGAAIGATVQSGVLETSAVDQISEMIDVLTAQRSYEGAEKIIAAIDATREKSVDDVARLK